MKLEPTTLLNSLRNSELTPVLIERLKAGDTPLAVAQFLQRELLVHTDVPPSQLVEVLGEFVKLELSFQERMNLVAGRRTAINRSTSKHLEQTSALEQLEKMAFLLVARIELAHEEELLAKDIRDKMRRFLDEALDDADFEQELDEVMEKAEAEAAGDDAPKPKRRKSRLPLHVPQKALDGTLDNTIETLRRVLVNIHEIRQSLGFDPRQSEKEDKGRKMGGLTVTPEFDQKKAKAIQDAMMRVALKPPTIDVEEDA